MKRITLLLLITVLGIINLNAEDLKQTIRGKIIDLDSNYPVIGANIVIIDSNPILGAATDANGEFRIDNRSSFLLL